MSSHKYSFKEWFGDEIERSSTNPLLVPPVFNCLWNSFCGPALAGFCFGTATKVRSRHGMPGICLSTISTQRRGSSSRLRAQSRTTNRRLYLLPELLYASTWNTAITSLEKDLSEFTDDRISSYPFNPYTKCRVPGCTHPHAYQTAYSLKKPPSRTNSQAQRFRDLNSICPIWVCKPFHVAVSSMSC